MMRVLLLLVFCACLSGLGRACGGFKAGWETSPTARSAVDQEYQAIAAEGRAGLQTDFAYALVLMKQRRYDDALRQTETVLKTDPDHMAARQFEIRLLMLTKSYAKAMVSLGRLSETLAEAPAERLSAERREELLRFLGRVIGFRGRPRRSTPSGPPCGSGIAARRPCWRGACSRSIRSWKHNSGRRSGLPLMKNAWSAR